MKKLLSIILFLATINLHGQGIKVAPVIGLNVTTINYSASTKDGYFATFNEAYDGGEISFFNPQLRPSLGVLADYPVIGSLEIRTGLIFNQKGGEIKTSGSVQGVKGKIDLQHRHSYLEIPLWGAYRIPKTHIKMLLGPVIGFALKAKGRLSSPQGTDEVKLHIGSSEQSDEVKPIDIGFNLGVSYDFDVAEKPLEVSLNFQPSFSKWNPSSKLMSDRYGRHMLLGIRIAYFFINPIQVRSRQ